MDLKYGSTGYIMLLCFRYGGILINIKHMPAVYL